MIAEIFPIINPILPKLYGYPSPFYIIASVILFKFFKDLNIKKGKKAISIISSASFSVYLISDNIHIRGKFILNQFDNFSQYSPGKMIFILFASVILIYIICTIIDLLRQKLFKICHVKQITEKIYSIVKIPFCKILDKITK